MRREVRRGKKKRRSILIEKITHIRIYYNITIESSSRRVRTPTVKECCYIEH